MSARRYVVTGSASGIGRAAVALLEEQGAHVVGADVREAEIVADLSTPDGRQTLVEGVRSAFGDAVDGVLACAGVASAAPETVVHVNYFGAIATLDDLRPLLANGNLPRAATIASIAMLFDVDSTLLDACLRGDEAGAARTAANVERAYATTKRGVARWVRRAATTAEWAGAGIALNAVAPGLVDTPMIRDLLETPEKRAETMEMYPCPYGGVGAPEDIAALLVWLTSPENRFVTGQVVFVDGGYEALRRGDDIW